MSRFGNLELGGESEDQSQHASQMVKDEAYYFGEARAAFETGNFEQALRYYSKVLEYNPQNAARLDGAGADADRARRIPRGEAVGGQALERFPAMAGTARPPRRSRSAAAAICRARWPSRTPPSRNAATRLMSGWRAVT